nr:hypothetical protein BgiMline_002573 [Biomphalaria glabrata]
MATKGIGFVRKLWHEKPDIAASLVVACIGTLGLINFAFRYDPETAHQHRYEYTVIREEDANPRLKQKGIYN